MLTKREILKTYFKYHIPLILASVIFFLLTFKFGIHDIKGKISVILGSFFLLAAPPVSLYLTRKKLQAYIQKRIKEQS